MIKPLLSQYRYVLVSIICSMLYGCNTSGDQKKDSAITRSEIRQTDEGYRLYLNGEPFYVQGAGLFEGSMNSLAAHGANSFRTWSTDNGKEILDKAHALGLKVMMGVWVGLERHNFDYDDEAAVQQQLDDIREQVLALKDHPALMIWSIGNELNHESENPKVWNAVNDISKMIHEVDPYHLTTTPLAGIEEEYVHHIAKRAPDLDFLSIQVYGAIEVLPQLIEESTYGGPLLVTEWGATGYWEVAKTAWGAPIENNSSVKADFYRSRYQKSIVGMSRQVMGSFVFLWGQKQERTPTWFGMFMPDGNETESVDVMHYIWNGEWPANRSPRLEDFTLADKRPEDNIRLKLGERYTASVTITDPDNDKLNYRWEVMRESDADQTGGDREEIPDTIGDLFTSRTDSLATFNAPQEPGAYRLFIYADDGNRHTAHANIPFWVEE